MKNWIIISISGVAVLILTFVLVIILGSIKQTPKQTVSTRPTPVIAPGTAPSGLLKVTQVLPENNATNISSDQKILITFNKNVSPNDIYFYLEPSVDYTITAQKNVLTVIPTQLNSNQVYDFVVIENTTQAFLWKGTFTTGDPTTASQLPTGRFDNLDVIADNAQREKHPDIFLSNKVPYDTRSFQVTTDFADGTPEGHYFFTVTVISASGKQDFLTWLQSLQLTDQQISSLDIRYQ